MRVICCVFNVMFFIKSSVKEWSYENALSMFFNLYLINPDLPVARIPASGPCGPIQYKKYAETTQTKSFVFSSFRLILWKIGPQNNIV